MRPNILYVIAKQEGYYKPGSLPQRLNNPGSLKFAHQRGATKGKLGFAKFKTPQQGWIALERDVLSKLRRGVPLSAGWDYL